MGRGLMGQKSGISAQESRLASSDRLIGDRLIMAVALALAIVIVLAYTVTGAIIRPSMYGDSGFGFLTWDSMRHGGAFNRLVYPDPANIARDASEFFTTWSPGQYLLPGALEWLGIALGLAIILVDGAFAALGLVGWFLLYRAVGFPQLTAAIAIAMVACSRHFGLPFGIYTGGEVLLFGAVPWFLLLVWRLRDFRWIAPPVLLVGGLILIFLKLSGLIIAACAIGAAAICADGSWLKREPIRRMVVAGATIAAMGLIFYVGWFTRGWNVLAPATHFDGSKVAPHAAFVLFASWGSSLSAGDLSSYILLRPGAVLVKSATPFYFAIVPFVIATCVFTWWRLRLRYGEYLRFAFWFAGGFAAVMVVIWSRGADIELEERYFRPVSQLLLVGFVHAFITLHSRLARGLFGAVAAAMALYGLSSYVVHAREDLRHPLGVRGFRQHIASAAAVDFLHSIDVVSRDGSRPVIVVPSPEIGLDILRARVIGILADFEEPELLKSRVWHGRVPALYVLIQKRLVANGKADIILRSFVDTPIGSWKMRPIDDEFVVYAATD